MRALQTSIRAALAAGVLAAMGCAPTGAVPPHLLGVWKTRDAPHHRNFVEIRRTELVLGVSGLELDVLVIDGVSESRAAGRTVYGFHYVADEGYRDRLNVTWLEDRQAIRIGSSAGTWTRSATR